MKPKHTTPNVPVDAPPLRPSIRDAKDRTLPHLTAPTMLSPSQRGSYDAEPVQDGSTDNRLQGSLLPSRTGRPPGCEVNQTDSSCRCAGLSSQVFSTYWHVPKVIGSRACPKGPSPMAITELQCKGPREGPRRYSPRAHRADGRRFCGNCAICWLAGKLSADGSVQNKLRLRPRSRTPCRADAAPPAARPPAKTAGGFFPHRQAGPRPASKKYYPCAPMFPRAS